MFRNVPGWWIRTQEVDLDVTDIRIHWTQRSNFQNIHSNHPAYIALNIKFKFGAFILYFKLSFWRTSWIKPVDSTSAYCAGGLPIESWHPTYVACRECNQLPYWPPRGQQVLHQRWISGICCAQARKHASEGSTLALKPRGDVTRSPNSHAFRTIHIDCVNKL